MGGGGRGVEERHPVGQKQGALRTARNLNQTVELMRLRGISDVSEEWGWGWDGGGWGRP